MKTLLIDRTPHRSLFLTIVLTSLAIATIALSINSCSKRPSGPTEPTTSDEVVIADPQVVALLQAESHPFKTTVPGSGYEDLAFLGDVVEGTRVVALGEATHGTKEFFQMKHRILEYLVTQMGFNMFAIEASWPEANLVNDYVQTGKGDPARLLAGLYFWTWNTQEVLDMILWMRRHNENAGSGPKVSFFGFDMQYPRMAMDNVVAYLQRVDQSMMMSAVTFYEAFRPYQDSESIYRSLSDSIKNTCQWDLSRVYDSLLVHRQEYEARTSEKEFALALRSARVAIQGEAEFSTGQWRDLFMAENAQWLLDQGGPDAKIVLWAHNGHVETVSTTMGGYLRETYGRQMVVFGFDFYQGSFNAVTWNFVTNKPAGQGLTLQHGGTPPSDSYEYGFRGADIPRFFLDLRKYSTNMSSTTWITSPHKFRSVGAIYDPNNPSSCFYQYYLPSTFDVVIYIQDSSPSTLLPFYNASLVSPPGPPAPIVDRF
jgi:erythromycin esterase